MALDFREALDFQHDESSLDFQPITPDAADTGGEGDGFLAKINAALKKPSPAWLQAPEQAARELVSGMVPHDLESYAAGVFPPLAAFRQGQQLAQGDVSSIPFVGRVPEIMQAEETPAGSKERYLAAMKTLMDVGLLAGAGGERAPTPLRAEPTLAERITQPRVEPAVQEPLAPVAPETPPAPEAGAPKLSGLRTADEVQRVIDSMEDRLVAQGADISKLYNPTDKIVTSDPVALKGLEAQGWQPMPPEMVEAYRVRDELGSGEMGTSVSDMVSKLKGDTGLPDAEIASVLEKYAITPGKTDVMAQYMASEHAVKLAQESPEAQAESVAYRLAAERGEMFDELRDISPRTLRDAANAVQSVREYFGLAESRAPKLAAPPPLTQADVNGQILARRQGILDRKAELEARAANGEQGLEPLQAAVDAELMDPGNPVVHPPPKPQGGPVQAPGGAELRGESPEGVPVAGTPPEAVTPEPYTPEAAAARAAQPEPIPQAFSDEPHVSAIANRFTAERAAAGELGEIAPGESINTMDLVHHGLKMSPEQVNESISRVMQGGDVPIRDAAALRGEEARLSQRSNELSRLARTSPEAQLAADNAFKDLTDFHNGPVAQAKRNWHHQGKLMQGEIPVDLSTLNGMREAWLKDTGRPPPAHVEPKLQKAADRLAKAIDEERTAARNGGEAIERATRGRKMPTVEEVRNNIAERMKVEPCIV